MKKSEPVAVTIFENGMFDNLKADFDAMVNNALSTMKAYNAKEATVTIKLNIGLRKTEMETGNGWETVQIPSFQHEVSTAIALKDKVTGRVEGDYVLTENNGAYYLNEADDGQLSLDLG